MDIRLLQIIDLNVEAHHSHKRHVENVAKHAIVSNRLVNDWKWHYSLTPHKLSTPVVFWSDARNLGSVFRGEFGAKSGPKSEKHNKNRPKPEQSVASLKTTDVAISTSEISLFCRKDSSAAL